MLDDVIFDFEDLFESFLEELADTAASIGLDIGNRRFTMTQENAEDQNYVFVDKVTEKRYRVSYDLYVDNLDD